MPPRPIAGARAASTDTVDGDDDEALQARRGRRVQGDGSDLARRAAGTPSARACPGRRAASSRSRWTKARRSRSPSASCASCGASSPIREDSPALAEPEALAEAPGAAGGRGRPAHAEPQRERRARRRQPKEAHPAPPLSISEPSVSEVRKGSKSSRISAPGRRPAVVAAPASKFDAAQKTRPAVGGRERPSTPREAPAARKRSPQAAPRAEEETGRRVLHAALLDALAREYAMRSLRSTALVAFKAAAARSRLSGETSQRRPPTALRSRGAGLQ